MTDVHAGSIRCHRSRATTVTVTPTARARSWTTSRTVRTARPTPPAGSGPSATSARRALERRRLSLCGCSKTPAARSASVVASSAPSPSLRTGPTTTAMAASMKGSASTARARPASTALIASVERARPGSACVGAPRGSGVWTAPMSARVGQSTRATATASATTTLAETGHATALRPGAARTAETATTPTSAPTAPLSARADRTTRATATASVTRDQRPRVRLRCWSPRAELPLLLQRRRPKRRRVRDRLWRRLRDHLLEP